MSETAEGVPVGASLTQIACPACGKLVPVECGDVTGLSLAGMIAVALAKADDAHAVYGGTVNHGPISVCAAGALPGKSYRERAAQMLSGGLEIPSFPWAPPA
jgi:hypothetical protein